MFFVGGFLPWHRRIRLLETVVQRRLAGEEVDHEIPVPRLHTGDEPVVAGLLPPAVGPDEVVVIRRLLRRSGGLEPRVFDRSVSGDQVEHDPDPAGMRLLAEALHVVVGSVPRRDPVEVRHVVSRIHEGGDETGIQPDCIHIQRLDVIQPVDDSRKVPDSVTVGVLKGLRINFVKHCIVEPRGRTHDISSLLKIHCSGF